MQFEGGYTYPSGRILILLSIGAIVVTVLVWCTKSLALTNGASLFLGLEGTALLASSYTPVGLKPPNGNFIHGPNPCSTHPFCPAGERIQSMYSLTAPCLFLSYI